MSKNTKKSLIAELLEQKAEVTALMTENARGFMEATIQKEVANSLKLNEAEEDLEDDNIEDDNSEYEETDVAVDDMPLDDTSDDDAMGSEDELEAEPDEEVDATTDVTDDLESEEEPEFGEDDEVIDLTNASMEEVINAIQDAPNGVIRLVKKPTFDLSVEGGDEFEEPADDMLTGDEEGEGELEEGITTEGDCLTEDCSDSTVFEEQQKKTGSKLNEEKVKQFIIAKNKQLVVAENKIKQLEKHIQTLNKQLNTLVVENKDYQDVLTEAKTVISEMALTNTKMSHIAQLYTNYVCTMDEKRQITESFDKDVTTINESKLAYKMWASKLEGQTKTKLPLDNKFKITENKEKGKFVNKSQTLIKEEQTYDELDQFERFANY